MVRLLRGAPQACPAAHCAGGPEASRRQDSGCSYWPRRNRGVPNPRPRLQDTCCLQHGADEQPQPGVLGPPQSQSTPCPSVPPWQPLDCDESRLQEPHRRESGAAQPQEENWEAVAVTRVGSQTHVPRWAKARAKECDWRPRTCGAWRSLQRHRHALRGPRWVGAAALRRGSRGHRASSERLQDSAQARPHHTAPKRGCWPEDKDGTGTWRLRPGRSSDRVQSRGPCRHSSPPGKTPSRREEPQRG